MQNDRLVCGDTNAAKFGLGMRRPGQVAVYARVLTYSGRPLPLALASRPLPSNFASVAVKTLACTDGGLMVRC
jgi:hypothetical protein